jgi:hypothetical protein
LLGRRPKLIGCQMAWPSGSERISETMKAGKSGLSLQKSQMRQTI